MIIDSIENRSKYYCLGEKFRLALDFFAQVPSTPFEKKDILLSDDETLVKARPMVTKPAEQCSFEAHKKYADIHYVAYGSECIGYANVKNLSLVSYDEEKDAASLAGNGTLIPLEKGYFMITLPEDAHMPCVINKNPVNLGKMIAKIKL